MCSTGFQTNLQFNNNKYYLIQLLQDDQAQVYSVWMRWGRGEITSSHTEPIYVHHIIMILPPCNQLMF